MRQAFELYSQGQYNVERLVAEMHERGLRTKLGKIVGPSVMLSTLHNPFYTGLIRIQRSGETFSGAHEPIVPIALFRRVQDVLRGKVNRRVNKYEFLFRQLFVCSHCGRCLIGEIQKGRVYYRCHAKGCPSGTVREDAINSEIERVYRKLEYTQEEKDYFRSELGRLEKHLRTTKDSAVQALRLQLSQLDQRCSKLTDAYLDGAIDRESFEQRKTALVEERRSIQDQIEATGRDPERLSDQLSELVELAGRAYLLHKFADPDEKRDLLKTMSSNRTLDGKTLAITLDLPFQLIADRFHESGGDPSRGAGRTWDVLIPKLITRVRSRLPAPTAT